MGAHEARGKTNEHYTPWYIFEALGERFDLDVASPPFETLVPAARFLTEGGLSEPWEGFVWMNPPFGHQETKRAWLARFFEHGNGVALTPDRTSAPWYGEAMERADAHLNAKGKPKFWTTNAETGALKRGNGPGTGVTLWAAGPRAVEALRRAASRGLGRLHMTVRVPPEGKPVTQARNRFECWDDEMRQSRAFREARA
ncbi:adenine methyltransferase [Methylobacterium sp. DM1]|nr:adenine methyltransferase [Methylobacterium sp. DM1]